MELGLSDTFPICLKLPDSCVWMGWVQPESGPAYFLKNGGLPVWCDRLDLLAKVAVSNFNMVLESKPTIFDLESLVKELEKGVLPNPNLVIGAWNILDDLAVDFESFAGDSHSFRIGSNLTLYDRIFSGTKAGKILHAELESALESDLHELQRVFRVGIRFVIELMCEGGTEC